MQTLRTTRIFRSLAVAALCLAVTAAYLVTVSTPEKVNSYCAMMPDTIGLYTGSHVTVRGIAVGEVTAITPGDRDVRVDFEVPRDHPLRGDVSATTVAESLVADRDLAVLFDGNAAGDWDPTHCITRTLTPKSMTETLDAVSTLASTLNGDGEPGAGGQVRDGISALRNATSGTGDAINTLINDMAAGLRTPDAATGHLGALIDATSSLSETLRVNWGEVKSVITRMPSAFEFINDEVFGMAIPIIERVGALLAWVNSLIRPYGNYLLDGLDATGPVLRWISANSGQLQNIVNTIPPVASALANAASGDDALEFSSPKAALPQPIFDQWCATMNVATTNSCPPGTDLSTVSLAQVVFTTIGAR